MPCVRLTYDLSYRGNDGELRLGIRRAAQLKSGSAFSNICSQQLNSSSIVDVVNAISTKSSFSVYYNPRYLIFKPFDFV